jgi:site-specific DNA-methyltransferase (adenine-specific)
MNPPYGREIPKWIEKAVRECWKGATIICLLPARPGSKWFGWLWNYKTHRPRKWVKEWRYLPGRIKFGKNTVGAQFPNMVIILERNRE